MKISTFRVICLAVSVWIVALPQLASSQEPFIDCGKEKYETRQIPWVSFETHYIYDPYDSEHDSEIYYDQLTFFARQCASMFPENERLEDTEEDAKRFSYYRACPTEECIGCQGRNRFSASCGYHISFSRLSGGVNLGPVNVRAENIRVRVNEVVEENDQSYYWIYEFTCLAAVRVRHYCAPCQIGWDDGQPDYILPYILEGDAGDDETLSCSISEDPEGNLLPLQSSSSSSTSTSYDYY